MDCIEACMDSHVHWLGTGGFSQRLDLAPLAQPEDISKLQLHPHHFRGEWLLGFGWDQNPWPGGKFPTRQVLDKWQPNRPVALTRCDAHAYWVNTMVLEKAGLMTPGPEEIPGGRILRGPDGLPSGVLIDSAKEIVDKIIPPMNSFDLRRDLLKGVQVFNEAGFTHLRDMTCSQEQWAEALRLDETGLLTLAVEEYFWLKEMSDLHSLIDFCRRARKEQSQNLRVKGLKMFMDGSLGSDTAHLSCCYKDGSHGLILWQDTEIEEALRACWQADLEVAVHAIGDEAVSRIIYRALKVKAEGVEGRMHLEHVEVIRPETVQLMKNLNVICHLQPSHFLSDRGWLKEKLGDLYPSAFPWRRLQEAGVPFYFGSDSPIMPPSYTDTLKALEESEREGIPRLLGNPRTYMSHPDHTWCPNTFTEFIDGRAKQVVFRGEHLL